MNHTDVLGHEAFANRFSLRSVETLVIELQIVNIELIRSIKLLRRSLLEEHIDQATIPPSSTKPAES